MITAIQEFCIINLTALQSGRRMAKRAANDLSRSIYGRPYKKLTTIQAHEFVEYLAGKKSLAGRCRLNGKTE